MLQTMLSSWLEVHVLVLGIAVGIILAALWGSHRDAALVLIGVVIALALGQSQLPGTTYAALETHRPIAAKPWYFLAPIATLLALRVGVTHLPHAHRKRAVLGLSRTLRRLRLL